MMRVNNHCYLPPCSHTEPSTVRQTLVHTVKLKGNEIYLLISKSEAIHPTQLNMLCFIVDACKQHISSSAHISYGIHFVCVACVLYAYLYALCLCVCTCYMHLFV